MLNIILPFTFLGILVFLIQKAPVLQSYKSKHLSHGHGHRLSQPTDGGDFHFEHKGITLSIWTTGLNHIPGLIALKKRSNLIMQKGYDAGIVACLVGGGVALLGSLWALMSVWKEVWREAKAHAGHGDAVARVSEAAIMGATQLAGPRHSGGGIQPMVPGITVPLSHLPTMLLALLLNQLIHEFGHAIAGAIDDMQMTRLSFNLHILLPSATVSFPSSVESMPLRSKLRLVCAGPFHNFLVWFTLGTLATSGLGKLFWRDRSMEGAVVQRVSPLTTQTSPLYGHVNPGEIITHLDDIFLGESTDTWSKYLSGNTVGDEGRGWCIDKAVYMAMSNPPCQTFGTVVFEPVDPHDPSLSTNLARSQKCFATHPILHIPSSPCPCPSSKWVCAHPSHAEEIMRIRLAGKKGSRDKGTDGEVILFAGDRREVLESVEVGKLGARGWEGLVMWYSIFFEYMSTIALSLFLFNLLPLPRSDGSTILRHLLSLLKPTKTSTGLSPNASTGSTNLDGSSKLLSPTPNNPRPMQAKVESISPNLNVPTSRVPSINLSRQFELGSDDEESGDDDTVYGDPESGPGRGGSGSGSGSGKRDSVVTIGSSSGGSKKAEEGRRRIRRMIEWGMSGVVGLWLVGWMFLGLLRSS